jgi:hypothetical protein
MNQQKLRTAVKITFPSFIAAVKIMQFAATGQTIQGIIIGAATGSLAIIIFWKIKNMPLKLKWRIDKFE